MSSSMNYDRGSLLHRLSVIGLNPTQSHQFVDLFTSWLTHNGPEWSIKRLKSLKVDLIRQVDNLPALTTYVRKNRRGEFHGIIGSLFRLARSSEKQFSKVLQVFCIYTSKISPVVTMSQHKKFFSAVTSVTPPRIPPDLAERVISTTFSYIGRQEVSRECDVSLVTYRGSKEKFAPLPFKEYTVRQSDAIFDDMRWFNTPTGQVHAWEFASLYRPVFSGIVGLGSCDPTPVFSNFPTFAGEVHYIQEPGYKLRAVASPYRVHQLALRHIGDSLGKIVRSLPWDCTFDQERSFPIIQEVLRSGRCVHSVDLSNATDYFPLDIQLMILRSVYGDIDDIKLIERISRMDWKSSLGTVRWNRGQPLGLYPSFFMFTLSHGIILQALSESDGQFLVVGDDVVIFDDELFRKYLNLLEYLGCPHSPEKSISSRVLAEFGGKVITKTKVIPQLKWRKMSNDSFLDLAKLLGRKSRSLMTKRQQKVFDSVKSLLPPVGCNMSDGKSDFYSAFKATEDFLNLQSEHFCRSLTGLIRTVNHNVATSSCTWVLNPDTSTLDERVRQVFQQTVFSHWKWLEHVAELPQALGLWPRLPIEASPDRKSVV